MSKCLPNQQLKKIINLGVRKDQEKKFLRRKSGTSKHWIVLLNLIKTGVNQNIFIKDYYELKTITILNLGQRQKRNGLYQGSLQEKNSS